VILPHTGNLYESKVPAAVHTINGFGKPFGFEQVRELGNIETPIALTGTLNVPRVVDALMTLAIEENPYIGVGFEASGRRGYASVNPVVAETSDGYLSDLQGRPVGLAEVRAALREARDAAGKPVAEGAVGAGMGTICYGWKGGIGTASRHLPPMSGVEEPYTVGALVQTNFGSPEELTILGVPVGRHLRPPKSHNEPPPGGSIMIVLATDAPLDSRQLQRLCHRAAFGLARTGSTCHGGSGDFVIAFSGGLRIPDRPQAVLATQPVLYEQAVLDAFAVAVVESVEEAIYNSLLQARTVSGRDGHTRYALPAEQVVALLRERMAV
jgi:D-aminopeptidase